MTALEQGGAGQPVAGRAALAPADLLSLTRIPLGAAAALLADRAGVIPAALVLAFVSDVLDGWLARRGARAGGPTLGRGAWLDPLCDKVFLAGAIAGLRWAFGAPWELLALVVLRELLQAVALAVRWAIPALRRARYDFSAHRLGKLTMGLQLAALLALALRWPLAVAAVLALAAGTAGAASVFVYVARALGEGQDRSP